MITIVQQGAILLKQSLCAPYQGLHQIYKFIYYAKIVLQYYLLKNKQQGMRGKSMIGLQLCTYLMIILCVAMQVCFAYNPRVSCYYNRLLFSNRYETFQLFLLRNSTTSNYYRLLSRDASCGTGFGRTITYNITGMPLNSSGMSLSSCANILMNGESCCPSDMFATFATNLNSLYNLVLNNTKYPIVKYLYDVISNLDANSCNYNKGFLPSNDPSFGILINTYNELIKKIQTNERSFINETLCLICLSTKDFTNFIYPYTQYYQMPLHNSLMYERNYFTNRTKYLTSILIQLESYNLQMINYISRLANSVTTTTTNCNSTKSQALNSTFIASKRVCNDEISCKKIVVQYFGEVATPQLLYYINRVSSGLGMLTGGGKYVISQNVNYGFKGNVSYSSMYGNRYLPNVTTYTPDNQYAGLY